MIQGSKHRFDQKTNTNTNIIRFKFYLSLTRTPFNYQLFKEFISVKSIGVLKTLNLKDHFEEHIQNVSPQNISQQNIAQQNISNQNISQQNIA